MRPGRHARLDRTVIGRPQEHDTPRPGRLGARAPSRRLARTPAGPFGPAAAQGRPSTTPHPRAGQVVAERSPRTGWAVPLQSGSPPASRRSLPSGARRGGGAPIVQVDAGPRAGGHRSAGQGMRHCRRRQARAQDAPCSGAGSWKDPPGRQSRTRDGPGPRGPAPPGRRVPTGTRTWRRGSGAVECPHGSPALEGAVAPEGAVVQPVGGSARLGTAGAHSTPGHRRAWCRRNRTYGRWCTRRPAEKLAGVRVSAR